MTFLKIFKIFLKISENFFKNFFKSFWNFSENFSKFFRNLYVLCLFVVTNLAVGRSKSNRAGKSSTTTSGIRSILKEPRKREISSWTTSLRTTARPGANWTNWTRLAISLSVSTPFHGCLIQFTNIHGIRGMKVDGVGVCRRHGPKITVKRITARHGPRITVKRITARHGIFHRLHQRCRNSRVRCD